MTRRISRREMNGCLATMLAWPVVGALGAEEPKSQQDWPLFRGNALSQGVAAEPLPPPLKLLWRYRHKDGTFEGTPTIVGDRVFLGDMDGALFCFELRTGKVVWKTETEIGFVTAPAFRDGRLFLGDLDGIFRCYDSASGKELWHFETDAEIDSSASFYGDRVLFGSQDATLYCLRRQDGKLVWRFPIADQIRCMPTVVGNRAFVAGCDGVFHMVDVDKGEEVGS
ncbi:MAG TPA: hypothetical protein ENJ16_06565, partial [Planctomycetaceae bacterium]|nr:hypothetical protein [Planctomycetaceae bacterium]